MHQLFGLASPGSLNFNMPPSGGRRLSTLARSSAAACDAAARRLQGLGGVVGHSVGPRGSRAAEEVSIGIRRKLCSDDIQLPLSSCGIMRQEQKAVHSSHSTTDLRYASTAINWHATSQRPLLHAAGE
ncbi:unnamed protein product, partial [Tilletia controversa]